MTIRCLILALFVLSPPVWAQQIGDHRTAGYDNGRSGLNSDAGPLKPPILPTEMVALTGFDSADSLIVFEGFFLVGQGGSPTRYMLFDQSGTELWPAAIEITSDDIDLDYVPAFANDIVLLGGPATSTVKAVRVSTGQEVWTDSTLGVPVGPAQGRHPILTGDLAVFHGRDRIVAATASSGTILWQDAPGTTAQAALAMAGNRIFMAGSLRAYDVRSGALLWIQDDGFGGNGTDLIATEKLVFQTDPATGGLRASLAATGEIVWSVVAGDFGDPGIALAYDRLYAFFSDADGIPCVSAYNPDTGELLWQQMDPSRAEAGTGTIEHAVIANNVIYFYNNAGFSGRLRALDALSGNPIWSLATSDTIRALSVADGRIYALFDESIQIYEQLYQVYFPQFADGTTPGGQLGISTLLTVNNLGSEEATGKIELFTSAAEPLEVETETFDPGSSFDITIPANATIRLQSTASADLQVGWARVRLDQPVSGTAIFQLNDGTTFVTEAGVGSSLPTGLGSVFGRRLTLVDSGDVFGTAVAIANVLDEMAVVSLEFRPADGGAVLEADDVELDPGNQTAKFLFELFPSLAGTDAEGTLVVTSDVPVVITAIRAKNGLAFSSFPVGQRP